MKNKSVVIRICIYIAMTYIMFSMGSNVNSTFGSIVWWLIYLVVIWVLVSWRTFNCIWVCDECDERFKISMGDSIKSFSIFSLRNKLYHRFLYCDKCKGKTWCRCIFEE